MNCNEEWKDIKGYEGYYKVSNFGRIKSLLFNREKILKTRYNKTGKTYFKSLLDAERKTGIDHSSISKCCRGKAKIAGGFYWGYYEKYDDIGI